MDFYAIVVGRVSRVGQIKVDISHLVKSGLPFKGNQVARCSNIPVKSDRIINGRRSIGSGRCEFD